MLTRSKREEVSTMKKMYALFAIILPFAGSIGYLGFPKF